MISTQQHAQHGNTSTPAGRLSAVGRGVALFLGGFSLLNLISEWHTPRFHASIWWLDFHPLPLWPARLLLCAVSLALLVFALSPGRALWCRVSGGLVAMVCGVALCNVVQYYRLLARGAIQSDFPLPFSGFICLALLIVLWSLFIERPAPMHRSARTLMMVVFLSCVVGYPLAQIYCFGKTDYRRPADVIVVFGARAYQDGQASRPLADRVETACALYRQGYAPRLLFSGGPGDGAVDEPEAMRRLAITLGVPAQAILLDHSGVDTHATVAYSCALFPRYHITRVLAVSHFFHLPRIKMTYQRAGWDVYTVPAAELAPLRESYYCVLRDMAAIWAYYVMAI